MIPWLAMYSILVSRFPESDEREGTKKITLGLGIETHNKVTNAKEITQSPP